MKKHIFISVFDLEQEKIEIPYEKIIYDKEGNTIGVYIERVQTERINAHLMKNMMEIKPIKGLAVVELNPLTSYVKIEVNVTLEFIREQFEKFAEHRK